jgi:hypothetical protein
MIQDVVCLYSNLKQAALQAGDFETFLSRKVGIEVAGPGELVSPLPAKAGGISEIWTICRSRAAEAGAGRGRFVDIAVARSRGAHNLR